MTKLTELTPVAGAGLEGIPRQRDRDSRCDSPYKARSVRWRLNRPVLAFWFFVAFWTAIWSLT
jgi:hypothetical protein